MPDYYVSALVRSNDHPIRFWRLWTKKIGTTDLATARAHALALIAMDHLDYGELQILWDRTPIDFTDLPPTEHEVA